VVNPIDKSRCYPYCKTRNFWSSRCKNRQKGQKTRSMMIFVCSKFGKISTFTPFQVFVGRSAFLTQIHRAQSLHSGLQFDHNCTRFWVDGEVQVWGQNFNKIWNRKITKMLLSHLDLSIGLITPLITFSSSLILCIIVNKYYYY
jgi:hypothetical protein